ncbi:NADH-quinone oxidoreductase subunit NuoN [Nocardioides salsibiostraticola]
MEFVKPTIEYFELSPLILVFAVACLGVVIEAALPRTQRRTAQIGLAFTGIAAAFALVVIVGTDLKVAEGGAARGLFGAGGTITVDGPTVILWGVLLVFAFGGVALFAERQIDSGVSAFAGQAAALPGTQAEREAANKNLEQTEVYPLMMFAVTGMLLFVSANDLLTMFVALEVLSLPLYLLCGLARRRRLLSQEAAMKYFLLGAFSSGFFLYGVALTYGFAGSMQFSEINEAVQNNAGNTTLLLIGMGMLAVGLFFKVGAAPFQSWTPDVYQGAPTAVTAFMAAATKVAAFGAIMRLFYVAFGADRWSWQPMMWVVAILTMLVGAILAIVQTDMVRMLAYSSVAHTGFLLTGVLGVQSVTELSDGQVTSLTAVLFYLVTYGFSTMGAFAICTLVRDSAGQAGGFDRWAGLGRRAPLVAGVFAFFLLAMAGIPLTSGFVGKWAVFTVAMSAGAWPVVLVAIASSVIAVYFYIQVIRLMFFGEPANAPSGDSAVERADLVEKGVGGGAAVATQVEVGQVTAASPFTTVTIAVCALATLVLGVVPGPLLDLIANAGDFIR